MAYTPDTLIPQSAQANNNAPRFFSYRNADDDLAAVKTAGYFGQNADNILAVGDIIYAEIDTAGTPLEYWLRVTVATAGAIDVESLAITWTA